MARILVRCQAVGIALVVSGALAPETRAQTGDPEAGARASDAMCDNCHGPDAEGGFAPDLAGGRGLTLDQFRRAIRRPWGVMPTLNEDQLSDQGVADVYAFVGTKPQVPEPGEWHWRRAPQTAPVGQQLYMNTAPAGSTARHHAVVAQRDLGEVLDEPREHGVPVLGVAEPALVVVVDAGEDALQRGVLLLERRVADPSMGALLTRGLPDARAGDQV